MCGFKKKRGKEDNALLFWGGGGSKLSSSVLPWLLGEKRILTPKGGKKKNQNHNLVTSRFGYEL